MMTMPDVAAEFLAEVEADERAADFPTGGEPEIECWCVSRQRHGTRDVVDIRLYTWGLDDWWHPSRYGVSISIEMVPRLVDELIEAAGLPRLKESPDGHLDDDGLIEIAAVPDDVKL
jgi:hypothetical protein